MSENKSLIRATRTIGIATLASRILGFIRDVFIAGFFGTGMRAQAFVVAFRIPNLLRNIVGEASANSAAVPVLSRLNEQGQEEQFWQVAACLLNILIIILCGLTLLGELFAPYIVRAIAPGFMQDAEKLHLTIRLTRGMFPYLLLIGLTAYAMAVLNSLKHFTLPAVGPCLLNIGLILSVLVFCPKLKEPADGLVLGVLLGGLLQLLLQVPLLVKKGLFRKGRLCILGLPAPVKEIGRALLPRTLGIAVYQINLFVDTIFATLTFIVGEGAPAALYYANRLIQFPLALFAIALAQAALPAMSALAGREEFSQLKKTVSFSLRSVFTMMVPTTVGIMVLAPALVKTIFERRSFTSYSTDITSFVLLFYCLGLSGYAGVKVLAGCFYSLKDTFTPSIVAAVALLINVVLNFILMYPLKMAGLALATAISVTVNFVILLFILQKRMGGLERFLGTCIRSVLASAVMGVILWFAFYRAETLLGVRPLPVIKLGICILLAMLAYLGALKVFAQEEARIFLEWTFRKR